MEMWTDIPQQVWKANVLCWLVYYVSLLCSTFYMLSKWKASTNETERRFILMDVTFGCLSFHLSLLLVSLLWFLMGSGF